MKRWERRQNFATNSLPRSRSAQHLCEHLLRKLPAKDLEKLLNFLKVYDGKVFRAGTLCSGSDVVMKFVRKLFDIVKDKHGINVELEHSMACESNPKKQAFIRACFPDLKALFSDVMKLGGETAFDELKQQEVEIPSHLDLLVAGFSCKNLSTEHQWRSYFAECLTTSEGTSGGTWLGVYEYAKCHHPRRLILENVNGLLKRCTVKAPSGADKSMPAQIAKLMEDVAQLSFRGSWVKLDTREFQIPHRRGRVYIPLERSRDLMPSEVEKTLRALKDTQCLPLEAFIEDSNWVDGPLSKSEHKYRRRAEERFAKSKKHAGSKKLSERNAVVDIAKSFADTCVDACTCLRPNSKPFFYSRGKVLGGIGKCKLQNIYKEDFPAIEGLMKCKGGSTLLSDIAGNSFTGYVACCVTTALLANSSLKAGIRSASVPSQGLTIKKCCFGEAHT